MDVTRHIRICTSYSTWMERLVYAPHTVHAWRYSYMHLIQYMDLTAPHSYMHLIQHMHGGTRICNSYSTCTSYTTCMELLVYAPHTVYTWSYPLVARTTNKTSQQHKLLWSIILATRLRTTVARKGSVLIPLSVWGGYPFWYICLCVWGVRLSTSIVLCCIWKGIAAAAWNKILSTGHTTDLLHDRPDYE